MTSVNNECLHFELNLHNHQFVVTSVESMLNKDHHCLEAGMELVHHVGAFASQNFAIGKATVDVFLVTTSQTLVFFWLQFVS